MKIYLGLLFSFFALSVNASNGYKVSGVSNIESDKQLNTPWGSVSESDESSVKKGLVVRTSTGDKYIYKDSKSQTLLSDAKSRKQEGSEVQTSMGGNKYIYKDKSGQVLLTNISPSGDFDKFTKKVHIDYEQLEAQYKKEQEKRRLLAKKPDAQIGMSKNQVLNNTKWGKPNDINTTIDASGKSEQWIYGNQKYLYFKNGKLTSMQY